MSDAVESLLDDIHSALLRGHFSEVASLTETLESDAAALSLGDLPMTSRIRAKAFRNEQCLAAALRGLRSARSRVEEIVKATQGLTTYNVNGRLAVLEGRTKPGRRF